MKSSSFYNGFTLTELITGILVASIAAGGIIIGSVHAKKTLNDLRLKQLAYEKLTSHTEYWKGKIAAGDIPSTLSNCTENIVLKETTQNDWNATLCYDLDQPFVGNSNAKRWELLTTIKWDNTSQIEKELSFFVIQMVF